MMKVILIVVCGSVLFLYSCHSKLSKKTRFIDDIHFVTYLYKDGVLYSEQEFEKDITGQEFARGYYKEYYPNGVLAKSLNYFDDKPVGTQIEYSKSGNENSVTIIFQNGYKSFEMKLSNGQITHLHGKPLHLYHNKNPIKVSDTLESYYGVIMSNNLKTTLKFKIVSPDGQIFDTTISNFILGKRENYIEKNIFDRPGNYLNIIKIEVSDLNDNVLIKDQVIDTIEVIE